MYKQEGQSWLVGHIHSVYSGVYVVGAAAKLRLTKTKCLHLERLNVLAQKFCSHQTIKRLQV